MNELGKAEPGLPRRATLRDRPWESAWELLIDH